MRHLSVGFAIAITGAHCGSSDIDPHAHAEAIRSSADTGDQRVLLSEIHAQAEHTCGLTADTNNITCWGNSSGMADWPRSGAFRHVSTGRMFSCATSADTGAVSCWGWQVPALSEGDFDQISVSGQYSTYACALRTRDGGAECWTGAGKVNGVPDVGPFSEIAVSDATACAIRAEDETMRCWGVNGTNDVVEPSIHAPPGGFKALAPEANFFCAIRTDSNEVVCWGPQAPADPPAGVAFDSFAITSYGSGCGIRKEDRTLECWRTRALSKRAPFGVRLNAITISGTNGGSVVLDEDGNYSVLAHACALREDNGETNCWGDDRFGQISGAPNRSAFREVVSDTVNWGENTLVCGRLADSGRAVCGGVGKKLPGDVSFKQITVWCGIRTDNGRLLCSGGTGDVAPPDIPFAHIAQRDGVVCGIRADNEQLVCFGADSEGIVSAAPSDVIFSQLSVGQTQACGLRRDDGHPVCWGAGATAAAPDISLRQVSVTHHINGDRDLTCGLRADDSHIVCWGTGQTYAPTDVAFSQLADEAFCGIRADNRQPVCWDGYGTEHLPMDRTLSNITANVNGACGISDVDGRLTCWGFTTWNNL